MFWLKIVLPAILALGIIGGIGWHFKHDRENEQLIGTQKEQLVNKDKELAQLKSDNQALTDEIARFNLEKKARNEEVRKELEAAKADQARAKAEADKARADRKVSEARLAEAQRKYREALNADANVRTYSTTIIPDAVLDRLRSANGEGQADSMRIGVDPVTGIQGSASRTLAWLQMPRPPSERQQE